MIPPNYYVSKLVINWLKKKARYPINALHSGKKKAYLGTTGEHAWSLNSQVILGFSSHGAN